MIDRILLKSGRSVKCSPIHKDQEARAFSRHAVGGRSWATPGGGERGNEDASALAAAT